MKKPVIILIVCWLCFGFAETDAQYLKVSTSAHIYSHPSSASLKLESAVDDDIYWLLDNGVRQNGYYHVNCRQSSGTGWIYRTRVRRYEGSPPVDHTSTTTMSSTVTDETIRRIFGIGQIPSNYYNNTEGLTGDALKKQLHHIIRNHKCFTYAQVWDALQQSDENPFNTNDLILLYTMRSHPKSQRDRGPQYDYTANGYTLSNAWNREHVWAKSRGFPEEDDTAFTDLHHLRPADRSVNSSRNNRSFNLCDEPYFDTGNTPTWCFQCSDEWAWEPPDMVKGDVARMIFYMAVRYEGYTFYGETKRDLEVVDSILHKDIKDPLQGKLSTLLTWHRQDPVDNWERRRNHIIYYDYQGNRNPFIDHPEFVEKIWKNIDQ